MAHTNISITSIKSSALFLKQVLTISYRMSEERCFCYRSDCKSSHKAAVVGYILAFKNKRFSKHEEQTIMSPALFLFFAIHFVAVLSLDTLRTSATFFFYINCNM